MSVNKKERATGGAMKPDPRLIQGLAKRFNLDPQQFGEALRLDLPQEQVQFGKRLLMMAKALLPNAQFSRTPDLEAARVLMALTASPQDPSGVAKIMAALDLWGEHASRFACMPLTVGMGYQIEVEFGAMKKGREMVAWYNALLASYRAMFPEPVVLTVNPGFRLDEAGNIVEDRCP